ncbi:MAG: effector binding domain-containing protein [Clostridia bacterium]|nr:effector binding domain-containing protein [Clostridia bacterium]
MNYQIKQLPVMHITGHTTIFQGNPKERKQQQHDFMVNGDIRFLRYALQGMAGDCHTEYCVISNVAENAFHFTVGTEIPTYFTTHLEKTVGTYAEKLQTLCIPAQIYVSVETNQGINYMNEQAELYKQMVEEWLPTSGYLLKNAPELSILHHQKENSYVEVLIPIEERER